MPYKDPEAARAYRRDYYLRKRELILAQQASYRDEHVEEKRSYRRKRYQAMREVVLQKQATYRQNNPEVIKQRNQSYRTRNAERIKERKRADYAANRAAYRDQQHKYRQENYDKILQQERQQYEANKEEINSRRLERLHTDPLYRDMVNTRQRENYAKRMIHLQEQGEAAIQARREKINAAGRAWSLANPDKGVQKHAKRRARKYSAARITLSDAQWREIKDAFGHRCAYCGRKMQRLTQDHITPLAQTGDHHLHNIVPACKNCNSRKGIRGPLVPVQPLLLTLAPSKEMSPTTANRSTTS